MLKKPSPSDRLYWGNLSGTALSYALSAFIAEHQQQPICIIAPSAQIADQLEIELQYFLDPRLRGDDTRMCRRGGPLCPPSKKILRFIEWETLPYDEFSPHEDIVSERIHVLQQCLKNDISIVITTARALLNHLPPKSFIAGHSLACKVGDIFDAIQWRKLFERAGYRAVEQVMTRGEFAIRGSIIDIFPMGSELAYRIDLFDDEIDSIRTFDLETQRSLETVEQIDCLPAHEFPLTPEACDRFVKNWQTHFAENTWQSSLLSHIKKQQASPGLEYYLPFFFEETASLIDYLPQETVCIQVEDTETLLKQAHTDIQNRFGLKRFDLNRPPLDPKQNFFATDQLLQKIKLHPQIQTQSQPLTKTGVGRENLNQQDLPELSLEPKKTQPFAKLQNFIAQHQDYRIVLSAESAGRLQILTEHCERAGITQKTHNITLTVSPLQQGLYLPNENLAIITEAELFPNFTPQTRSRKSGQKSETPQERVLFHDVSELNIGDAIVHIEHGVGRYLGLTQLSVGNGQNEFLHIEYANGDKLYVPTYNLHLVSRYSGANLQNVPINQLGSKQWERAKAKAAEKIHDVAAELLELQAKRSLKPGFTYQAKTADYQAFADEFAFEPTPDQQRAIDTVITDMARPHPMDRLICGDVGFGKTEVAMRAAFIAAQNQKQVAIMVPTTLLAKQHYQNFCDRFANWPIKITLLSGNSSGKALETTLKAISNQQIDIVIGTHKLLGREIQFHNLGLIIIDEEHRFGVRQKEKLKALRAEVDVLTMTATPIPRTLNMALSGIRDISIIASPPPKRLAIKTFIFEYHERVIKEAVLRETLRGGQVYYLHNNVQSMAIELEALQKWLPSTSIAMAHGQMPERQLEQVMRDFYHNRYQVLLCSTIIETGIDIPNANTMIINRSDKLGLAQLHQLRGRVGRSHHQAYAYLLTPPWESLTSDAQKRLQAIESTTDLGAGYLLANHDLEIRGAGELLGDDQSGNMQTIGYNLYMELLEKTAKLLKQHKTIEVDTLLNPKPDINIDLRISTIIPEDYIHDPHVRLRFYQKISQAPDVQALEQVQIELIDRFGLLPDPVKYLIQTMQLKFLAKPMGIVKISAHAEGGKIDFNNQPNIDPMKVIKLIQLHPKTYQMQGQNCLKFTVELEAPKTRIDWIVQLLQKLS